MKKNYLLLIIILILLAVNACSKAPEAAAVPPAELSAPISSSQVVQDNSGKTVLYWYDPMVADKKFDKPGKSPFMDMQLVPKYKDESSQP